MTPVTPVEEEKKPSQQYLEDLPPKFEDKGGYKDNDTESMYTSAVKQIKLSDFTLSHYVAMPCFREAMITGFQAMGVLGAVTFLIRKNLNKSVNWAVCGFFLGSAVGWEQCRSIRKKSFQAMERAREVNQNKNKQKWESSQPDDPVMKTFNDQQSGK